MEDLDKYEEFFKFSRLFNEAARNFDLSEEEVVSAAFLLREELKLRPWRQWNFSGIDYDNPQKLCGYLNRFAACHCALTRHSTLKVLTEVPFLGQLLRKETLKIVSAGGGPGNDLIGFCSAVSDYPGRCFRKLHMTNIDCKSGWEKAFLKVFSLVSTSNYGKVTKLFSEISVTPEFVAADLSQSPVPNAINSADVVIMTKVLSNTPAVDRTGILQEIFAAMAEDAIFLFTDIDACLVRLCFPGMPVLYSCARAFFNYVGGGNSLGQSSYEIIVVQKKRA